MNRLDRPKVDYRPQRILLSGTSGSGKTTLARRLAAALDLPHTGLDALFHGPDWTPRPTFVTEVEALAAQDRWVTEWQYATVRRQLAARADLVVWLDLPRRTVMRCVVSRTVRRRLRRTELWNGNIEPPFRRILTDREYIVRWAWTTYHLTAERTMALAAQRPELPIVRLRRFAEYDRWLAGPAASALSGDSGG